MQQQRKFEGRIPKIHQQTTQMTTLASVSTTNTTTSSTPTSSTDANISDTEGVSTKSSISSQNQTDQAIVYATMLPAATTLNGIPSHHQPQYITMQAPTTTLSPTTHTTSSPITAATTDGTVYQYKSEIICDTQHRYQQQQQAPSQSHDNHDFSNELNTKSSNSDHVFVKPFQKNENSNLSTSYSHTNKNNNYNTTNTNTTKTSSSLSSTSASLETLLSSKHEHFINSKSSSNNEYATSTHMATIDPVKIFYEEVLTKQEKAAAQARLYNIAKKNTSFGFVDQFTDFVMNNNAFHQQQYRNNKQRNNSNSHNMREQQHKSNQSNIKEKPQISNCYQQHKEIGNNGSTIKSTINRSLSTSSNFASAQNWRGSNNYKYQQPTQSTQPYYNNFN